MLHQKELYNIVLIDEMTCDYKVSYSRKCASVASIFKPIKTWGLYVT